MKYSLNSDKLKKAMKRRGMSVQSLANLSGVTKECVYHYVAGRRQPNAVTLLSMCDALDVSPVWLMTE